MLRSCVFAIACAASLWASAPAQAAAPLYSQRLVLGYASGVSDTRAHDAVEKAGGRVLRRLGPQRGAVIEGRSGLAAGVLRSRLLAASVARYVEPDFLVATSDEPTNDPLIASQYAL